MSWAYPWRYFVRVSLSAHEPPGSRPLNDRPPLPPFTRETAAQKVQAAEDAWNTRDPERVSLAYSEDSVWRNRDTFLNGRAEIVAFLTRSGRGSSTTRFARTCGRLTRTDRGALPVRVPRPRRPMVASYGNELGIDEHGLMMRREASINDSRSTRASADPRPTTKISGESSFRCAESARHARRFAQSGRSHICFGAPVGKSKAMILVVVFVTASIVDRRGVHRQDRPGARYTSCTARGDWWARFESEFRDYAQQSASGGQTRRRRHDTPPR